MKEFFLPPYEDIFSEYFGKFISKIFYTETSNLQFILHDIFCVHMNLIYKVWGKGFSTPTFYY
jgi:hypothetical protein